MLNSIFVYLARHIYVPSTAMETWHATRVNWKLGTLHEWTRFHILVCPVFILFCLILCGRKNGDVIYYVNHIKNQ